MNIDDAVAVLETYLSTNWTATPLAFENVEARNWTEAGQPLLPDGDEDYVALRTEVARSDVITVPGRCRRYQGMLFLGVCVRDGTGTRLAMGYAARLVELLEGKELSSASGTLRVWTMTGMTKYRPVEGWLVTEVAFNFSFERYVSS